MLIDDVRLALRLTTQAFDAEIQDLIDASKTDLSISGVVNIDEADPLIKRAITVYVKTHFGMHNDSFDKFDKAYDMLKKHLVLSVDYNEVTP